ncbi:MAG: L,D-transpeptidase family protein [Hyphomicrobiaceae bacterium]
MAVAQTSAEDDFGDGLEPFKANGPLIAIISLDKQRLNLWDRNGVVASSRVSTGRKSHETPQGVFSIIQREVEHYSNLYDDAEMPFMQRITWSGVALHQGYVPKYPASHGCIRLPDEFAERLFRTTKLSTRVLISAEGGEPLPISHPVLPQPDTVLARIRAMGEPQVSDALFSGAPPEISGMGVEKAAASGKDYEHTLAELRQERDDLAEKLAKTYKTLRELNYRLRPMRVEQGREQRRLRRLEVKLRRVEGWVAGEARGWDRSSSASREARARIAHIGSLMALAKLKGEVAQKRDEVSSLQAEFKSTEETVKRIDNERKRMTIRRAELWRVMQPVTVFVSRQEGMIYIRRTFQPLLEAPAMIKSPEQPLGTHVFTAFESENDQDKLDWRGVTLEMPGGGPPPVSEAAFEKDKKRSRRKSRDERVGDPLEAARSVLNRIALPDNVLEAIHLSLQPGSTLIISDLGPSIETGPGTDIVVQTKGEEAAKASLAKIRAQRKGDRLAEN